MAETFQEGTWLLIDAAGPDSVAGLLSGGDWLHKAAHQGDFLEWHKESIQRLLQDAGMGLSALNGAIYACGPGSTLGLRLAAMFIRSLMTLPHLAHWRCYQYQNLELALAGMSREGIREAVAPWRRDSLHHTRLTSEGPLRFLNGGIQPSVAVKTGAYGFLLGRRPENAADGLNWRAYPHERIPAILSAFPELLRSTAEPQPYMAEDPQFAKWSARRHSAS